MTSKVMRSAVEPLDGKVDHVRGPAAGSVIVEYGDYECPYSKQAFQEITRVEGHLNGRLRFAFWDVHELLFDGQEALEDQDLRRYAAELALDVTAFDRDRRSAGVLPRIHRDVERGRASGEVLGAPTLFIDGVVHLGGYGAATLLKALAA
jgi:NhaA family Na+:H+ antiporter